MPGRPISKLRAILGGAILLVLFVAMVTIHFNLVRIFVVVSDSMLPTLEIGDRVLMDNPAMHERFSVVSLQDPTNRDDPEEQLVKRVVGIGGDTVEIRYGELWINGERQDSPQVTSNLLDWPDVRVEVPYGHVFVLGDNRNASFDSLNFGPVPEDSLTGVLGLILWPPDRWGAIETYTSVDSVEDDYIEDEYLEYAEPALDEF